MSGLDQVIARLDEALSTARPGLYSRLRPPLDEAGVIAWSRELGIDVPADLAVLHRWHDGSVDDPEPLFAQWTLTPSAVAVDVKRAYDAMVEAGETRVPSYWSIGWIPVLHDDAGNLTCLDADARLGGTRGQLIGFSAHSFSRQVEFPTLQSLLEALVKATSRHGSRVPVDVPRPDGYPQSFGA